MFIAVRYVMPTYVYVYVCIRICIYTDLFIRMCKFPRARRAKLLSPISFPNYNLSPINLRMQHPYVYGTTNITVNLHFSHIYTSYQQAAVAACGSYTIKYQTLFSRPSFAGLLYASLRILSFFSKQIPAYALHAINLSFLLKQVSTY